MATLAEDLATRLASLHAEIAALTNKSDMARKQGLYDELEKLQREIKRADAPVEVFSRAIT